MKMKMECVITIMGHNSISMYHYPDRDEMQFDITNGHDKIVTNIGLSAAKEVRDRLNEFLKYHNQD